MNRQSYCINERQEAQLLQKGRATVSVVDTAYSLKGHSRSIEMIQFKSFGTVSYSHFIATKAVSSAVLTQYTNVTDTQPPHDGKSGAMQPR